MKVLVTGGTGFIGPRLITELVRRGDRVRCLVRRPVGLPAGVEAVGGNVLRPDRLDEALAGVEVVYHLAGATVVPHPLYYRRVNALGSARLAARCAAQQRPPLLVYLSSLAAAGPSPPGRPRTEDDPPRPVSRYGQSKLAGELAMRALAPRLPVTIVRAPSVFGPGEPNLWRMMRAAAAGVMVAPVTTDLLLSWVHVDDLVAALLAATERGKRLEPTGSQGVYFVALEEPASLGDAARLAASLQGGGPVRILPVPRAGCLLAGRAIDLWNSLTGDTRLLTLDKMREALAGPWVCRVDRAREEMGHTCAVSLAEGFARLIAWYKDKGLL